VAQHLQAAGHVIGMTGDGVNDAPALRQPEVGIAVSTATDVAKGVASVVLTEPGLTNIVSLVEQGRTIYQRILTWIINKISRTILKAAFVAIAFVMTGKFVVSAFAVLLMVAEALLFLWIGWSHFGLTMSDNALYTLQLPDAALLCRILRRVRAGAPLVLGDDAQQNPPGGADGGCAHGHRPDVRGSSGTHAIALVADARDFRLCDGLLPCCELRCKGGDDQTARSRSGGIDCRSRSVRKRRCAGKDCIGAASQPVPCHGGLALCQR